MTQRTEARLAAERVSTKALWVIVAVAAMLSSSLMPVVPALGTVATFAILTTLAMSATRNEARYQKSGAKICSATRLLLAVGCACTLFLPDLRGSLLWTLSGLLVALEGFVEKNAKWGITFTLPVLVIQLASALVLKHFDTISICAVSTSIVGFCFGFGLSQFRERGELLFSTDHRLSSLLECGSELAASCDLDAIILHTLKSAVHETGATCGYVMLLDDLEKDILVTEAAYGIDGEFQFPERMEVGSFMSGYVAKVGQPITVTEAASHEEQFDGVTAGVVCAASIPLVIRGFTGGGQSAVDQTLGVITLLDLTHSTTFNDANMELLRTLASLISVAVSNAKMEEKRRTTFLLTLESLATALEARDEYTRGHSQRVCEVSLMIGEKLGLGSEAIEELRVGTILHDIGKIGVPDAILNKRARLTDEEFMTMKSHPVIGYEICKPLMLSEGVLMIIRNHHEKLDGSGYPDGLKGGELPLSLRIVCVADAFDAMSSRRPYRNVMDTGTVLAELSKGAGTQFDPVVVENLKELMITEKLLNIYREHWGEVELKVA